MQSGGVSVQQQQQENQSQQQTPPPLTQFERIQLRRAGQARRNKTKSKRSAGTNFLSVHASWLFMLICGGFIAVGFFVQYHEFWLVENIDVKIDYKVPLFYVIEMVFTAAGIYAFGRPYGPIIVQLLGLAVIVPVVLFARAYEEWVRRTIFLFSFMALLIEHRRTRR